ncbi:hypothetical protein [Pannonibacter sp. SL95]|uniref:hypothetical protein n=1 Tax=Pannonibacter sp. SL95 TaxID=2995153 RepID=UPI002274A7C3|nr:hypothetical protein [Pannonibacter sp. SL95]MCY1707223.1 hypothetical protein [Pannonibacter sp. SL95]
MIRLLLSLVLFAGLMNEATAGQLRLLMFEQAGCVYCLRWHEEIGPKYPLTDEGKAAPLERLHLRGELPQNVTIVSRPAFTPTFILLREGHEVGRIEGYPGEDFFWPMLAELIEKANRPSR